MAATVPILRKLRSVRRVQQILGVLVRYGFDDVVHELGLHRVIEGGLKLIGKDRPEPAEARKPAPVRIRETLQTLGPTFVKLGQILSTRPDLVPPEYCEELKRLQKAVPPERWEKVQESLAHEFPEGLSELFAEIDPEPIAAASMAQVHRARLASGERIVLKILRPGIRETIEADMEITRTFAQLAEKYFENVGFDPVEVAGEFARELARETDLSIEARSTDRMRRDFEGDDAIGFPRVYFEASTPSVLALEEIEGQILSDVDLASLTPEARRRIVEHAADAVFRQCLAIGFFHADPHPGNIFVLPGERIRFVDCGMTGHIDPSTAELLATLVHGLISADLDRVVRTAVRLGSADPALVADRRFRAGVWRYVQELQVDSLEELEIGVLLAGFFDLLREQGVRCPADLVYLIKALSTIEGVATEVAPDFDLIAHVRPYVETLVKQRYGLPALRRRFESALSGYTELVEELPDDLRDVFSAIRQKRLSLTVDHKGLEHLTRSVDDASMNVSYALLVAALIIGSSLMLLATIAREGGPAWIEILAVVGYISAGVIAIFRLVALHLSRRGR